MIVIWTAAPSAPPSSTLLFHRSLWSSTWRRPRPSLEPGQGRGSVGPQVVRQPRIRLRVSQGCSKVGGTLRGRLPGRLVEPAEHPGGDHRALQPPSQMRPGQRPTPGEDRERPALGRSEGDRLEHHTAQARPQQRPSLAGPEHAAPDHVGGRGAGPRPLPPGVFARAARPSPGASATRAGSPIGRRTAPGPSSGVSPSTIARIGLQPWPAWFGSGRLWGGASVVELQSMEGIHGFSGPPSRGPHDIFTFAGPGRPRGNGEPVPRDAASADRVVLGRRTAEPRPGTVRRCSRCGSRCGLARATSRRR